MPRGPNWNQSWDRLLIMFKYLTTLQYSRIAEELRKVGKPWCTITALDIRSRLRHKWNSSLGMSIEVTLPSWPFSKDLQVGNGLRGEDFRDVKVFIEHVAQYEDLNETGQMYASVLQHMRDNPHLFPDDGVPKDLPPADWMGYIGEDEVPDPQPAVQVAAAPHLPLVSLTPSGNTPSGIHQLPRHQPQASRPRITPPSPPPRVFEPGYSMTLEAPDQNLPIILPVLIAGLDQIQKLANGKMSLKEFGHATRGSAITINPIPNIRNPVFVKDHDDTYGLHPGESGFPYAAATTVMYERLGRGETSLDEFMASLPSVKLTYLPKPSVAGQPQVQRLIALNPVAPPRRPFIKRTKRKQKVETPEHEDVEEDRDVTDVTDFDKDLSPDDENPFDVNPFEGDPFEPLHKRIRTETPTGVQVGTIAQATGLKRSNPFDVIPSEGDHSEPLHKRIRTETPAGVQVGTTSQATSLRSSRVKK